MIRVQTTLPICLGLLLFPAASRAVEEPVRVATMVSFVAEVVELVPERAVLVGEVQSGERTGDPETSVMDLGSPHAPSLEALASANPDVIVVSASMHAALIPKLARFGDVIAIDTGSVSSTLEGIRQLGVRLEAESVINAEIERVQNSVQSLKLDPPVSALTLYAAPGEPVVVTERTWIGDLLVELGITDIAEGATGTESYPGYVRVSEEVIAGLRPDCVLLVTHSDPEASLAGFWGRVGHEPAWKSVLESVEGRVYVLPPAQFGVNPGLRMADAAASLLDQLDAGHPADLEASIP